jgi:hypothetical protein
MAFAGDRSLRRQWIAAAPRSGCSKMGGTNMRFLTLCFCVFLLGSSIAQGQEWSNKTAGITCHLVTNWFRKKDDSSRRYKIDFDTWKSSDQKDVDIKSSRSRRYQLFFTFSNPEMIPGFDIGFFYGPTAPGLGAELLVLKAISKTGNEETFYLGAAGTGSAENEEAFCFVVSDYDDSIEKFLRCLSGGNEKFSLSVLSPDKARKEPVVSVVFETEHMRDQLKEFLAGCSAHPPGNGCHGSPPAK